MSKEKIKIREQATPVQEIEVSATQEEVGKAVNAVNEMKIFRKFDPQTWWNIWNIKRAEKMARKAIALRRNNMPGMNRHLKIHVLVKAKIVRFGMWFLSKVLDKYLVKDFEDIPKEPFNNLLRIFYKSMEDGLDDMWKFLHWNLKGRANIHFDKKFKNAEEFVEAIKDVDYWSHRRRLLFLKLWFTEILEDSADREWLNNSILEMYWNLNKFYKGKVPKPGEFPTFMSDAGKQIKYFVEVNRMPIWEPSKPAYIPQPHKWEMHPTTNKYMEVKDERKDII